MLRYIRFLVIRASGLGASCRSWAQRGARPAGVSEGARRAQGSSDSSSTGRWWPASSLPAAGIATGYLIFANYAFFLNGSGFISTVATGGRSRTWMCCMSVRKARGKDRRRMLGWGTAACPGRVLVGTGT